MPGLGAQAPLYEIKANLFKALAHPVRIRILELLCADVSRPVAVGELLEQIDLESSHLSSHLAVLRRHGVVASERVGSAVFYRTAHPAIPDLLAIARAFLLDHLGEARSQLEAASELPALAPAGSR